MTRNAFIFFLAFSLLIGTACDRDGENRPETKNPVPEIKRVNVDRVRAQPLEGSVEYVGTLCAYLKVNVATEIGGSIEKFYFEKGQRVEKGQMLAEISTSSIRIEVQQAEAVLAVAESNLKKVKTGSRPEEIRIAAAAVEQAEASLLEAEHNFKRIKALHQYQATSNSDYDAAKRAVETARANLESAQQQLQLARKGPRIEEREAARASLQQAEAALALAKDRLKKSILLAPCDGVIAFRELEEGEVVGAGTIITQAVDTEKMKIKLSLGEKYIPLLDRQKQFPFTVDAIPGREFHSRLAFVSPIAEPATRSFPMELSVDDPDVSMADGMTVRVRFPLVDPKKSIRIHTAWLTEEQGEIGLFVVQDDKAVFRRVTLGGYYEQRVEILSGLNDNALVITNPAGLRSGDDVAY